MKLLFASLWIFILSASSARAEVIEFPEEELARESVYPIFDQPEAVKKRLVPFAGRVEVGAAVGATLNDPFFNSFPIQANSFYHLSEFHALGVVGSYVLSNQTSYVSQIQAVPGGRFIDFDQAPKPTWYVLGLYEFTPYYGKVSLTKQTVFNLALSFEAGLGTINLSSDSSLDIVFGMNQRLFVSKDFALKAELEAMLYQQNDVVLRTPAKRNIVNFVISLGALYLLPNF